MVLIYIYQNASIPTNNLKYEHILCVKVLQISRVVAINNQNKRKYLKQSSKIFFFKISADGALIFQMCYYYAFSKPTLA